MYEGDLALRKYILMLEDEENFRKVDIGVVDAYYLYDYHPFRNHNILYLWQKLPARCIWGFKEKDSDCLMYFTLAYIRGLKGLSGDIRTGSLTLVAAPTSKTDEIPPSGLCMKAITESKDKRIRKELEGLEKKLIYDEGLLLRTDIPDFLEGTELPAYEKNYMSIQVREGFIPVKDTTYIIADDVLTLGDTMTACAKRLHEAGVPYSRIKALVLSRTVRERK